MIPYESTKDAIYYRDGVLQIGKMKVQREDIENIYVVGVGKGAFPIAQALDEIFKDEIRECFLILKEGY